MRFLGRDFGFQEDVGLAAAEELAEHLLKVLADGIKRLLEAGAAFGVDFVDEVFELLLGAGQVAHLRGEEFGSFFQFVLLGDGVEIDIAQALDLLAKLADFLGDGIPIDIAGLITRGRLRR